MAIFPKLSLWRRSLCSNLGGIDPEKLYRATLSNIYLTSTVNVYFLAHVFTNLKEVPIQIFLLPSGPKNAARSSEKKKVP